MRRIAILVANSEFGPGSGLSNLRFPIADVHALQELLGDQNIGKYDRVVPLINKRSNEVFTEINSLLDEERGASVLFYYSGHGKPSDTGKLYLAAADTTDRLLPSTAVSFSSLLEMKDSYGYGRFAAILDCCFAGLASPDIKGAEDDTLKAFTEGRGIFFLGAANATQAAKEDARLGHGLLTAGIIEGLKSGLADVDGDGRISGPDLFAWSRDFARRLGAHLPVQVNRVAEDDLVLAFAHNRRLSASELERVRAKLIVTFENRLMPTDALDRLRAYFLDKIVVPAPAPLSLEGRFLAYAIGQIGWAEIGVHGQDQSSAGNNNHTPSAAVALQASAFTALKLLLRNKFSQIAMSILLAALALGTFFWWPSPQIRPQSVSDQDACKQYPALCGLEEPSKKVQVECFKGLGDCPPAPPVNPNCLKGLGDCPK